MSEHYLIFAAQVNQQSFTTMINYITGLHANGATKLTVAISSMGGHISSGVGICNALKSLSFEVNTHNFGSVDSIANVIFSAGKKRFVNASSTFMFHGAGFESNPQERLEEKNLKEKLDTIKAEHQRMSKILSSSSTLTERQWLNLFRNQNTKNADWAIKCGFATGQQEFLIPTNANVMYLT